MVSSQLAIPKQTIEGIQYLRGVAAMMVACHHALGYFAGSAHWGSWTAIGATGVDIFFVISGFIMAYTTQPAAAVEVRTLSERAARAKAFILKRIVRVVPLYWIALGFATRRTILHGQADVDLVRDFAFVPRFNHENHGWIVPALSPGWTINAEMFFYAIFAGCMIATRRNLVVSAAILCTMGVIGALVDFDSAPARFYTSSWLFEFALGIAVFMVWDRATVRIPTVALWAILGLAAFALGVQTRYLPHAIPAALIVYASVHIVARCKIRSKLLRILGDASYSIYLFHYSSFGIVHRLIEWTGMDLLIPALRVPAIFATHALVAASAGVVIHFALEKPLLRAGRMLVLKTALFQRPANLPATRS